MSFSQYSPRASHRSSTVIETFRPFSASLGSASEGRLERRRWMGMRAPKPKPDIATALCSSGWLATASPTEVRLFRISDIDTSRDIKRSFSIEVGSVNENIRGIALSEDLLAIITYKRLIVYAYTEAGDTLVESRVIDQSETWTPKCVAIRQRGSAGPDNEASAWIAVGGDGKNGARVFKYSYNSCWNAQRDRAILGCSQNTSAINVIGFSPDDPSTGDYVIVFGATTSNRIYCWGLTEKASSYPPPEPTWNFSCDVRKDGAPHRGEITSVSVFLSPSKTPYIFCAVTQQQGSRILRSCIAPLESRHKFRGLTIPQWREIPGKTIGRRVLSGIVTPNGQFIVIVEKHRMRLLTLQGAYEGGLTCSDIFEEWPSSLKRALTDVSAISLLAQEESGRIKVVAADGHGHIVFARVSVPSMPPPPNPRIERRRPHEMSSHAAIRELSSTEISRYSGSTLARGHVEDRIEVIPG